MNSIFQTMLSIRDMQETIDDDALCDTIAEIKLNKPQLFPSAKSLFEFFFILRKYFYKRIPYVEH